MCELPGIVRSNSRPRKTQPAASVAVRWALVVTFVVCVVAGCGRRETNVDRRSLGLEAYCTAVVIGTGIVDVETDYLPRVVNCENGAASFEALKVQAIAARSYLYYRLDRTGDIGDGTGDQVYSCGRQPGLEHFAAVDATAGQVLQYQGTQVAAFYVAGALQTPPGCQGGQDDPTDTERFVTYNMGRSGANIEQTSLGFVDPTNKANRGCMSQNGSDCLSDDGRTDDEILRFYYGEDIERVTATGDCVAPPALLDAGGGDSDAGAGDPGVDATGGRDAAAGVEDNEQVAGACGCRSADPPGSHASALWIGLAWWHIRRRRALCDGGAGKTCATGRRKPGRLGMNHAADASFDNGGPASDRFAGPMHNLA